MYVPEFGICTQGQGTSSQSQAQAQAQAQAQKSHRVVTDQTERIQSRANPNISYNPNRKETKTR